MDKLTAGRRKQASASARAQQPGQDQQDRALSPADEMGLDDTPTEALLGADNDLDVFASADEAEARLRAEEERQAKLDAFASALEKKRTAAVNARQQSGIEQVWREDEEFYEGIDDANRGEESAKMLKPRDFNGTGGASIVGEAAPTGSTVFLNITRAYVDFSAGRAADMLLPTDEPNWDLTETPMPDIIKRIGDDTALAVPEGVTLKPGAPSTIGQAAQQMIQQAKEKVGKAKTRIEDWMEEGQYSAEQRKVLRDAAKVGTGILKGPFPVKKVARAIVRDEQTGAIGLQVQNKTAPISKCISYWNLFPDAACGENIHNGNHVFERDRISARQLRDLLGTAGPDGEPLYIESAIRQCLREGPQRAHADDQTYQAPDTATFDIWYFNGVAEAEDLRAAGLDVSEDKVLPVVITMVNGRVIKAALSTLDSGEFPYDVMVWQEREGHWAGIGVARQVRTPQRMINAGTRNMMDNAGLGAGPQIVISEGAVKPAAKNDNYSIRPRKLWTMNKDSGIDDVRKAFAAIEIPMVTAELMNIIQFALKMAEDVTGMPMLLQGQQGQASETVGGMQILTNNSNTPLRAIAKLFDDRVTVPHLTRYYEWLLLYGPEEDEKGEFVVAARGSSALFERDAQNQAIMAMAPIVENPVYKINPEKWFRLAMKAQRLDPDAIQYSETEWAEVQQRMQQSQPADPRLQAAQIAADARLKAAQLAADVQKERIQKDTDRDTVYIEAQTQRDQNTHDASLKELELKRELALLDYANQNRLKLEDVKAQLAQTAMKVQAQKELSAMTAGLDLHKHANPSPQVLTPPTEPAGRAAPGEAFQA